MPSRPSTTSPGPCSPAATSSAPQRGTPRGHASPPCTARTSGTTGSAAGTGDLLGRLRRATGAEAYHTAYRDGLITVVDTTAPVTDAAHPFTPGPEQRAHATAHGKALLAALPRPLRRRYLAEHGMARFTERTITSAERFEAEVDRVRGQGIAVSVGEADLAYTCLAVALPERGDGIVHALSVSLPTADFGRRQGEIRAALTRAAPEFPALPES